MNGGTSGDAARDAANGRRNGPGNPEKGNGTATAVCDGSGESTVVEASSAAGRTANGSSDVPSQGSGNARQTAAAGEDDAGSHSVVVEVFPVEFHYVVVDGRGGDDGDDGGGQRSDAAAATIDRSRRRGNRRVGVALASRASLASDVLREIERAATAPSGRASDCARLWRRSTAAAGGRGERDAATRGGDGYDLLDVGGLTTPSSSTVGGGAEDRSSAKMSYVTAAAANSPSSTNSKQQSPPLTVERWLGLPGLSAPRQRKHRGPLSRPVVVELLVEMRGSPKSNWDREPLELGNRLQVSLVFF